MLYNLYGFLVVSAGLFGLINADYYEECEGVDQEYIAIEEDCSYFIFCHGEDSFKNACPDDSPYFSIVDQTCDLDRKVCGDRPFTDGDFSSEVEGITEDGEGINNLITAPSVAATKPTIVTTTENTISSVSSSLLPSTSSSSSSSTSAISITPTTSSSPSVLPTSCPAVDNPNKAVFLSHPKSCSEYYLCYQGQRLPMHCSNMLHFDVRQQKCDYPERVKCQVRDNVTARDQCLAHTIDVYPHLDNCNYYYQCTLGYLRVMQCPLNMGWHYEKRACVLRQFAKCYNSANRFIL